MRDYERKAIADAAYDAWRFGGQNYDAAWDRAQDAVERYGPLDCFEAEDVAERAANEQPTGRDEQ